MSDLDSEDPLSSSPQRATLISSSQVPSLEDLVDACCISSSAQLLPSHFFTDPLTPENFVSFINKAHCNENLQFLIEIYKYENIWNQLFKRRSSILKCKKKPSNKILSRTYTASSTSTLVRHDHEEHSRCCSIINKIDLSTNEDISSFVNTQLISPTSFDNIKESWNDFDHQIIDTQDIDLTSDLEDDDQLSCLCNEIRDDADPQIRKDLIDQWGLIIKIYILDESPYQINLPSHIYANIIKESKNKEILYHSPEILIEAKNFTLQLLRENIYEEFLDYYDKKSSESSSPATTVSTTVSAILFNNPLSSLSSPTLVKEPIPTTTKHQSHSARSLISHPVDFKAQLAKSSTSKLHTVQNILPLSRGHTFHSSQDVLQSTRGPCNVRVSEYSLYGQKKNLTRVKSHGDLDMDTTHKKEKGWMKKLLKH